MIMIYLLQTLLEYEFMMAKCVKTIVDSMKEKNEYQYP